MKQTKLSGGMGEAYYRRNNLKYKRNKWQECVGVCLLWAFIGTLTLITLDIKHVFNTKIKVCNFESSCINKGTSYVNKI